MNLYSTNLLIEDTEIPYQVYKEGDRLFFRPLKADEKVDPPLFWVSKASGEWLPINIHNENFIKQVQENILNYYSNSANND